MASPVASSVLLMLLVAFTAGANASNFFFVNQCTYTVWPAAFPAFPAGSGAQLIPGQTGTLTFYGYGYGNASIWGRTGCSFNGGSGSCQYGDCAGAYSCSVPGQPPVTVAVFTHGVAMDEYYISVNDGFNVAMAFRCVDSDDSGPRCYADTGDKCPEAYPYDSKVYTCPGNSNYRVIFCP